MKYFLLAMIVAAQLACKKASQKTEETGAPAQGAVPIQAHLDPRNAASTLNAAQSAARKLEAAEAKQSEELGQIQAQ